MSKWKETKRRWKVKRAERKLAEEVQRKREAADRLRAHEDARLAAARQQVEQQLQALAAEVTPPGTSQPEVVASVTDRSAPQAPVDSHAPPTIRRSPSIRSRLLVSLLGASLLLGATSGTTQDG